MERVRRRQQAEEQPRELLPASPAATAESPPPLQPATVQVIWGPIVEHMAVGGMTVAGVRTLLQHPYNIPPHAALLVNGEPVTPEHRLAPGDILEFARAAGEKGAGRAAARA